MRCTGSSGRTHGWKLIRRWSCWTSRPRKSRKRRSMPVIASAIDQDPLFALITKAREVNAIVPGDFASMMFYDLRELEERANVPIRTAELDPYAPQLQAYMRRALQVIDALLAMELSR